MNNERTPELEYLKGEVIRTFTGASTQASEFTAFASLAFSIEEKLQDRISESTLKRLWGYVSLMPSPRKATLDILARYAGRKDYAQICQELVDSSELFTSKKLSAEQIAKDAKVKICWEPDRCVLLEHLDGSRFKVLQAGNSKLREADEVQISEFMQGQPLYMSQVVREGKDLGLYVAGKKMGLKHLEIL